MESSEPTPSPSSHTAEGGVLVGQDGAAKRMVIFEDPQCPYCCEFEEVSGGLLRSAREGGTLATEYQMRCFLGVESVRADNALALAAEEQRFDELRTELFAAQPLEGSGGFTTLDLVALGQRVGLTSHGFVSGVHEGRYVAWVLRLEELFRTADPQGTPAAWLDDRPVDARVLYDPEALAVLLDL